MKEGFTFNWASLKFLRKVTSKHFGGGGGQKRAQYSADTFLLLVLLTKCFPHKIHAAGPKTPD